MPLNEIAGKALSGLVRSKLEDRKAAETNFGRGNTADFLPRAGAFLVDMVLCAAVFAPIGAMLNTQFIQIFGTLTYFVVLEGTGRHATLGKMLFKIKVSNIDSDEPSFGQVIGRNVAKAVSAIPLFIGFLFAAFTMKRQALHDLIAKTLVIKVDDSRN